MGCWLELNILALGKAVAVVVIAGERCDVRIPILGTRADCARSLGRRSTLVGQGTLSIGAVAP